jgi:hypothetical protein
MRFSQCSALSTWHSTRYSILFTMLASLNTAARSFSVKAWNGEGRYDFCLGAKGAFDQLCVYGGEKGRIQGVVCRYTDFRRPRDEHD